MIHEIAFGIELAACSRASPRLIPKIVRYRVPKFGVVGQKVAQIVANRPDVAIPFDDGGVLRDTLARSTGEEGVRASVGTVTRSPCGKFAVKRANDPWMASRLALASRAVRLVSPDVDRVFTAPLADEARLETELKKNRTLRESLDGVASIVVPVVHASTRLEVTMDFEDATLVRDLKSPIDLGSVRALFRTLAYRSMTSGVMHCDLHSANVGVRNNQLGWPEFVLYDFGCVRRVDASEGVWFAPGQAARAIESAAFGNWDAIYEAAMDSGAIVEGTPENFRSVTEAVALYAVGACDVSGLRPAFAAAGGDLRCAPGLAASMAAFATLEATCKRMNPDFDVAGSFAPGISGLFAPWGSVGIGGAQNFGSP